MVVVVLGSLLTDKGLMKDLPRLVEKNTFTDMDLSAMNLMAQIEEDLQEFGIEKNVRPCLKTPEEIERLTVDEGLSDIERAVHLLSSGQDVQWISVACSLPELLQRSPAEALRRVLPKVREVLHVAGPETQLASAESFLASLRGGLVTPAVFAQGFLPAVLMNVEHRDPAVANAWLQTLLSAIEIMPKDLVKREVLGIATAKGQLSQAVPSRIVCCKILGKIATKFDAYTIGKEVLPLVRALCQDVELEVRATMCRQLESVARGLGLEQTRVAVLPELLELAADEEGGVRTAALETLTNAIAMLDSATCRHTVVPLVEGFCERALAGDENSMPSLALNFGRLCHSLSATLSEEQRWSLLEHYCRLSRAGAAVENGNGHSGGPGMEGPRRDADVHVGVAQQQQQLAPGASGERSARQAECRRHCAYNLPAMVQFAQPENFSSRLRAAFAAMCHDRDAGVRATVASSLLEVAKLLAPKVHLIHKELLSLLQDESLQVLDALVDNLTEVLLLVRRTSSHDNKAPPASELIAALLAAEARAGASLKWRLHERLVASLAGLPAVLSSDQLYYKFVPVAFRIIDTHRVLPVQQAAVRTLCTLIRHNRRHEQRQEMCDKLVAQLCRARSFRHRVLFLDACGYLMEHFSRAFLKRAFFTHAMALACDPVANVRMRLCSLLPRLKALLRLPGDHDLQQQLEAAIRRSLSQERDADALAAVRKAVLALDRIEVAVDSLHRKPCEEDLIDEQREQDENLLMEEQREREKQHADSKCSQQKPKGDKKKGAAQEARKIGKLSRSNSLSMQPPAQPVAPTPAPPVKGSRKSSVGSIGSAHSPVIGGRSQVPSLFPPLTENPGRPRSNSNPAANRSQAKPVTVGTTPSQSEKRAVVRDANQRKVTEKSST
nr:serine/threonine-protein phosphatase 4 regulatory subunit 4 isoform X2 [Petromyzon marinus]